MVIERFLVEGQVEPRSHYCHSVRAGELNWVSGIVAMTADGQVPKETTAEFDIVPRAMDACLRTAGGRPDTVTKVQLGLYRLP